MKMKTPSPTSQVPPRSGSTTVAECLYHEQNLLFDLGNRAKCSPSAIISLAWAIVLQAFYQTETICISIMDEHERAGSWERTLSRNHKALTFLEAEGDNQRMATYLADRNSDEKPRFAITTDRLRCRQHESLNKSCLRQAQDRHPTV
jgi:hypothetical protein